MRCWGKRRTGIIKKMSLSGNEIKRICVVTATRAEYGLLKNVITKLMEKAYDVLVAVTGTHLSEAYGYTVREIEEDGIPIDVKINILADSDNALGISRTMASAIEQFAAYFEQSSPELLVVLGDRYETLSVCIAAMNARIPIAGTARPKTTATSKMPAQMSDGVSVLEAMAKSSISAARPASF